MMLKHLFRKTGIFQNGEISCRFYSIFINLWKNAKEKSISVALKSKKQSLQYSRALLSISQCLHKSQDKKRIIQTQQNSTDTKNTLKKHEYLFGVGPCFLALKSNRRKIFKIFIRDGAVNTSRNEFEEIRKMAEDQGLSIYPATRRQLLKLSQDRPAQNIVMEVSPLKFSNFKEKDIKRKTKKDHPELWVALDEVQDPMNFGAILRTSSLLGVSGVIVPLRNSAPLSPVVSKASAGAMEMMNIFQVAHMPSFLKERANAGWDILGAVQPYSNEESFNQMPINCTDYKMNKSAVLVLGNEGVGLQSQVLQQCTHLISIFPPSSSSSLELTGPDSLNVSVATGILVFLILKNRQQTKVDC